MLSKSIFQQTFSISLPPDLLQQIEQVAQAERASRASIIRRIIACHFQLVKNAEPGKEA